MWEELVLGISSLSVIILAVIGIIKSFFKKFKVRFPKWYKATFYILSLALVISGSIITQLFIIEKPLESTNFVILILGTGVTVFGGYQGYESTSAKNLVKKAVNGLKSLLNKYSDSKVAKMIEKVGIEKIDAIASTLIIKTVEIPVAETVEKTTETNTVNVDPAPMVTIEEKKEGE